MRSLISVTVVFLLLVLGCKGLGGKGSSASFDPYKGKLSELLQKEISSSGLKFKLAGVEDVLSEYPGATEAKVFTYMQEGAGVQIKVDGAIANYPSAAQATDRLAQLAKQLNLSPVKKGNGQRAASSKGELVVWTNGSLICLAKSDFAKPAGNFEEAVSF